MSLGLTQRATKLPGVSQQVVVDTSKWGARVRNMVLKQLRTGVYKASGTGELVRALVGRAEPIQAYDYNKLGHINIYKEYVDTPEMEDLYALLQTTAEISGNGSKYVHDSLVGYFTLPKTIPYKESVFYAMLSHCNLSLSAKWRSIVDPIIADIEAGKTIVVKL